MSDRVNFRPHRIKKSSSVTRVDGEKVARYSFTCPPCEVYGKSFPTKSARDTAAEKHQAEKPRRGLD